MLEAFIRLAIDFTEAGGIVKNIQCDQIGLFLNALVTSFLTNVAQIACNFLGCFQKCNSYSKKYSDFFQGNLEKNWATLYSYIWSHWKYLTLSNVVVGVLVDHSLEDLGRLQELPVDDRILVDLSLAQKFFDRVVRLVLLAPEMC